MPQACTLSDGLPIVTWRQSLVRIEASWILTEPQRSIVAIQHQLESHRNTLSLSLSSPLQTRISSKRYLGPDPHVLHDLLMAPRLPSSAIDSRIHLDLALWAHSPQISPFFQRSDHSPLALLSTILYRLPAPFWPTQARPGESDEHWAHPSKKILLAYPLNGKETGV